MRWFNEALQNLGHAAGFFFGKVEAKPVTNLRKTSRTLEKYRIKLPSVLSTKRVVEYATCGCQSSDRFCLIDLKLTY